MQKGMGNERKREGRMDREKEGRREGAGHVNL